MKNKVLFFVLLILIGSVPASLGYYITGYAVKPQDKVCAGLTKQMGNILSRQDVLLKKYDLDIPSGTAASYIARLSSSGDCSPAKLAEKKAALEQERLAARTREEKKIVQQSASYLRKLEKECSVVAKQCKKLEGTYDDAYAKLNALQKDYDLLYVKYDKNNCARTKAQRKTLVPDLLFCDQPDPRTFTYSCTLDSTGIGAGITCADYRVFTNKLNSDAQFQNPATNLGTAVSLVFTNDGTETYTDVSISVDGKNEPCYTRIGSGAYKTWPPGYILVCGITGVTKAVLGARYTKEFSLKFYNENKDHAYLTKGSFLTLAEAYQ